MKENPNTTTIELSNVLLVSVRTIERDLKALTEKKLIEYVGSSRDGYWKVNKWSKYTIRFVPNMIRYWGHNFIKCHSNCHSICHSNCQLKWKWIFELKKGQSTRTDPSFYSLSSLPETPSLFKNPVRPRPTRARAAARK